MTNEQTIDEIMDAVLTSQDSAFRRGDGLEGYEESVAADQYVRDLITAALAAKDAEIERLKAKLAGPAPGECNAGRCGPQTEGNEMTNEQTIDEIMDAVLTSQDSAFRRGDGLEGYEESVADDQYVRDLITAALAAKDAEIERLKAKLAGPAPGEWIEWAGGKCPIADDARIDVKCRDGDVLRGCLPSNLYWSHYADGNYLGDIVAYRVMA